ncbi:unnamed protein product [Lepeophtheirus salmonis]|uniref:(salmon louse) hypothetical protein n=1 Tax=Lepeophtheirus salmonis TaxID=72036 RepID=A0A7R8CV11_LEPSM|nr:unnamed protein product [Lepeophtheirus salmonis]CAF2941154.1 unnamed protein product [Lepeophtheirus salmonis]
MLSTWVRKLFQSKFYKQTTFLWTENNYWNHHLFGFVGWKYSDDPSASLKVSLITHIVYDSNSDLDWSYLNFRDPEYLLPKEEFPDDEIEETEAWKNPENDMGSTENCVRLSRTGERINHGP